MSEEGLEGMAGAETAVDKNARPYGTAARYERPEDLFCVEYDRLVAALTVSAGNRELAADAVQDAFARLIVEWPRVGRYDDPAAWVRRVALNRIRDHQRRVGIFGRIMARQQPPRPSPPPDLPNEALWHAVRRLPERQRTAVALHYVADLRVKEVAQAMRISEGSVNQHLHRARKALRGTLGESRWTRNNN